MRALAIALLAASAVIGAPAEGLSAKIETLGEFDAWTAFRADNSGRETCYIHAEPLSEKGKYSKRGEVFVQVIHAPADYRTNEVVFDAGYTYRNGSSVTVNIDSRKFVLFTEDDTAWTSTRTEDLTLVRAMRRGRRMVVRGRSWRGTLTTDTYSLNGFTAAHRAASRACEVRWK